MKRPLSRRQFIGQVSCAAVGSTALFSTLLNLRLTATAAAQNLPSGDSDYRALVCLFLAGGNDSFNMLVPGEPDSYSSYQQVRSTIALSQNTLLPIQSDSQATRFFGLHPALAGLQQRYLAGELAFLANVGTLIVPLTVDAYLAGHDKPLGLFSHSDQQMHWQTAMPHERGGRSGGWGGRTADIVHTINTDHRVSMSISFANQNTFQIGDQVFPYIAGVSGNPQLQVLADPVTSAAANSILDQHYKHLFLRGYVLKSQRAVAAAEIFNAAWQSTDGVLQTQFPDTSIGRQLAAVVRTIASQEFLGVRRQTFFVRAGGWDHHTEVLESQDTLLREIDEALEAYWKALGEINRRPDVVLFSASDFGRTLTSNGLGSDHGWGGNHFILGGAVRGGDIFGHYPLLHQGNAQDIGRGRLLPSTSTDAYFAELASWFGVAPGELDTVLPNCRNFFDPATQPYPLGCLG